VGLERVAMSVEPRLASRPIRSEHPERRRRGAELLPRFGPAGTETIALVTAFAGETMPQAWRVPLTLKYFRGPRLSHSPNARRTV
jgi:hypothetical protein